MPVFQRADLDKVAVARWLGDGYSIADDVELRFDWQDQGGGTFKPIYIGTAENAESAASGVWVIQKFTWGAFGVNFKPTRIQTLTGAWDDRASLGW